MTDPWKRDCDYYHVFASTEFRAAIYACALNLFRDGKDLPRPYDRNHNEHCPEGCRRYEIRGVPVAEQPERPQPAPSVKADLLLTKKEIKELSPVVISNLSIDFVRWGASKQLAKVQPILAQKDREIAELKATIAGLQGRIAGYRDAVKDERVRTLKEVGEWLYKGRTWEGQSVPCVVADFEIAQLQQGQMPRGEQK